jgi:hypothetical protein
LAGCACAYVEERDIRPAESALAVIYPDDVARLVAVVVASRSRMLELEIDYPRTLDHASAMSEGTVVSSDDDAQRILEENGDWVEAALDLLADERGR